MQQNYEPILDENNHRFTLFPITYTKLWDNYKKQVASFWKAEEIDFSKDYDDFITLKEEIQEFIKRVLAFFAPSDGIVNFNLQTRFLQEIKIPEAVVTYTYQMMMENIHSEVYSIMLDNLIKDKEEKKYLFNSIKNVESVKLLSDWAIKWIDSDLSFAHRVIAFAVVEGVFFSGAFASIFWLKRYQSNGRLFLPGLIKSNEFIARDEGMHVQFACDIYELLEHKLPSESVYSIVKEGVDIAKIFTNDALPIRLIGMNSESMGEYIEYVADRLLVDLGYRKYYNVKNPFTFMETIGMTGKTNFFEARPTEYQSSHVLNVDADKNIHEILDDF